MTTNIFPWAEVKDYYLREAYELENNHLRGQLESREQDLSEISKKLASYEENAYTDPLSNHEIAQKYVNQDASEYVLEYLAVPQSTIHTVSEVLNLIKKLAPKRVEILNSARQSAKKVDGIFEKTDELLRILAIFVTRFWSARANAQPIEEIFTNDEYAAKESESTVNRSNGSKQDDHRWVKYKNEWVYQEEHLKINKTYDKRFTLRIHFHWSDEDQLLVIGYCGEHLPTGGKKQ